MNVYQIWSSLDKDHRGSRSSYQKAASILLRERLIGVKEKAPWFGKRIETTYGLTTEGLIYILCNEEKWCKDRMTDIARNNRDLAPDFLGLWYRFRETKVEDIAFKVLLRAAKKLNTNPPSFPEQIDGRNPTASDWLPRLAILPYDAIQEKKLTMNEAERWYDMILEESRAEKLYSSTLRWVIDSHRSAMQGFSKALERHEEAKRLNRRVQQSADARLE